MHEEGISSDKNFNIVIGLYRKVTGQGYEIALHALKRLGLE